MRTAGRMARREKWNGGEGRWRVEKKVGRNNEAKEEDLALTRVSGMRFAYVFGGGNKCFVYTQPRISRAISPSTNEAPVPSKKFVLYERYEWILLNRANMTERVL